MYTSYPLPVALGNSVVTTPTIADGAVTTDKLADVAVTAAKLGVDAVTSNKIANNAVMNSKIADNAVTRGKINDDAINEDKIDETAADAIKTLLAVLTPVNDNGTDLGSSGARVRTLFVGTSITNAGNLSIELTGATTRTLTIRNTTSSQQVDVDLDGDLTVRSGGTYGFTLTAAPDDTPSAFRAVYFPNASGRVILDSDVRASRIRVPLVSYASVDIASPATQTIGLFYFDPAEYAVPGKTTVLNLYADGGTSAGTLTVSLYNLTGSAEVASITLAGTLTGPDHDTDTVALPGGVVHYAVRASVGTDGEYGICAVYLDVSWS